MKAEELPLVLNVPEAAKIMRVSSWKMYEMAKRPDFPKIKDGGRILIPTQALMNWMNETALKVAEN